MNRSINSQTIGWTIDRNPDLNILSTIRNTQWNVQEDEHYSNWNRNSINYNTDVNINNYSDSLIRNVRNINSPWINDDYQENPVTRIRNNRYFNHNNTINDVIYYNLSNIINNNGNVSNGTNTINSNDDFIPFHSDHQQTNINIHLQNFNLTDEERQCCICMEERQTEEICRLNCQHSFCVECTYQHLQTNHTCPICRTTISDLYVQNNDASDRLNLSLENTGSIGI